MTSINPILAHQYGWDEALLFVRRLDKRSKSDKPETPDEE